MAPRKSKSPGKTAKAMNGNPEQRKKHNARNKKYHDTPETSCVSVPSWRVAVVLRA